MALSQDEQRMLAEIERRLAADDPGLASCLTTFRRPGPATVLRSPRVRIIGSLFTVLLVAMVALMVYAMIPFRTHMPRHDTVPTASTTANTSTLAAASSQPPSATVSHSVSNGAESTTSQSTTNRSAAATATGKTQQAKGKPTNRR
jgi:cytoskeletal protein RodZ